jgi:hypothetical protein
MDYFPCCCAAAFSTSSVETINLHPIFTAGFPAYLPSVAYACWIRLKDDSMSYVSYVQLEDKIHRHVKQLSGGNCPVCSIISCD